MLAAFPPPGLATPTREVNTPVRPISSWPTAYPASPDNSKSDNPPREKQKKGRRCCGLPFWVFILLLLLLVVIVAAAVVIPLYLLVLNKKTTPELSSQQKCAQDPATACQNGGMGLSSFGTCACICINGFTGSTCSNPSATACTTTTLSTGLPNVTLGDAIPRLVRAAQSNFSIPLDSSVILARFSSSNLSCLSENALVTFDGVASNDIAAKAAAVSSAKSSSAQAAATAQIVSSAQTASPTPSPTQFAKERRQVASINGIYVDTSTAPSPAAQTSMQSASPTTSILYSSSTTASTATPTAIFTVSDTVTDFARVAVLFILQQETLEKASVAQNSFQRFFNLDTATNKAAQNISLGGTNTANLVDFRLSLGGEIVGSLNTSTLSRRQIRLWDC